MRARDEVRRLGPVAEEAGHGHAAVLDLRVAEVADRALLAELPVEVQAAERVPEADGGVALLRERLEVRLRLGRLHAGGRRRRRDERGGGREAREGDRELHRRRLNCARNAGEWCVCARALSLSLRRRLCVRCGARRGGASRRSTPAARRQSAATDRAAAACRVRAGQKLSPPAGDVVRRAAIFRYGPSAAAPAARAALPAAPRPLISRVTAQACHNDALEQRSQQRGSMAYAA